MYASTSACEVKSGSLGGLLFHHFAILGLEDLREAHVHLVDDGLRGDAVLLVVGGLNGAAAIGFVDGLAHGVGHSVGVEDGAAFKMARGAAHGLDERAGGAQEAFLVGVENGDQ